MKSLILLFAFVAATLVAYAEDIRMTCQADVIIQKRRPEFLGIDSSQESITAVQVILGNISDHNITVLRGDKKPIQLNKDRATYVYYFSADRDVDGENFVPSSTDFSPTILKPREKTRLAVLEFKNGDHPKDRYRIVYKVSKELGVFFDCWTGELSKSVESSEIYKNSEPARQQ